MLEEPSRIGRHIQTILAAMLALMVFYLLKIAQVVFVPLVCALLLVLLVAPLHEWLAKRLHYRWYGLSLTLAMTALVLGFGIFLWSIWFSLSVLTAHMPVYAHQMSTYWASLVPWAQSHHIPLRGMIPEMKDVGGFLVKASGSLLTSLSSLLSVLILIFFLVLLLLIELPQWRRKIDAIYREEDGKRILGALQSIGGKVRMYFVIKTVASLLHGVAAWAWLAVLGSDFAFVGGFISFTLNYIPYLGSIIASVAIGLVVFLQYGFSKAFIALAWLFATDQVIGNYLEPRFQGKALVISPFLILASLIFWSWLWGISGTIVGVPLTIAAMVAFENMSSFSAAAIAMKEKGDESHERLNKDKED